MKKTILSCIVALGLIGSAGAATLLQYTSEGTMSGRLNDKYFTDLIVRFLTIAQIDAITYNSNPLPTYRAISDLVTVDILGLGAATILTAQPVGVLSTDVSSFYSGTGITGFFVGNNDLLDTYNSSPSYNLSTAANFSGTAAVSSGITYSTTLGNLIFYSVTGNSQFSAQIVPEPSTYALFGLGALVLVVARRRKW